MRIRLEGLFARMKRERLLFPAVFLILMLFVLYGMCLMVKLEVKPGSDDAWYLRVSKSCGLLQFLGWRYVSWTGRLAAEAMIYLSIHCGALLYHLFSPLFILLAAYSIGRLFTAKTDLRLMLFALLSFGLCNFHVLGAGIFWFTGSYNYLVPVACGLFGMIPFADAVFRGKISPHPARLALSAAALAVCSLANEQASLVAVSAAVFAVAAVAARKKKAPAALILLAVLAIAGLAVNITAPGVPIRWHKEVAEFFPGFNTLTLGQHLKYSVNWFFNEIVTQMFAFVLALSAVPFVFWKKYRGRDAVLLRAFGMLSVFALFAVKMIGLRPFTDFAFLFSHFTQQIHMWRPTEIARLSLLFLFWTVFLLLLVYLVCRVSEHPVFTLLCFAACFASMALLFFSPSIVASGSRVLFVGSVLLMILLTGMVKQSALLRSNAFLLVFAMVPAAVCIHLLDIWCEAGFFAVL